jgi:ribosome recycling factor
MDPSIIDFKKNSQETVLRLKEDLKSIRTGRANASLVDNIVAEVYGGQTKLKLMELATITTDGPTTIVIAPFDPSTVQDIEKSILKSPLGLSPNVQGNRILVKIPALSQEQREKMIKLVNEQIEETRNIIRNHRDNSRKIIKNNFTAKIITEDDKFRLEKEIDNLSQKTSEEIASLKEKKENEILEV